MTTSLVPGCVNLLRGSAERADRLLVSSLEQQGHGSRGFASAFVVLFAPDVPSIISREPRLWSG